VVVSVGLQRKSADGRESIAIAISEQNQASQLTVEEAAELAALVQ
jgi:hypothetical protein